MYYPTLLKEKFPFESEDEKDGTYKYLFKVHFRECEIGEIYNLALFRFNFFHFSKKYYNFFNFL